MNETMEEAAKRRKKRLGELLNGQLCPQCDAPLYSDPTPEELGIFLHAWKYRADDGTWAYETEQPDWAAEDY